MADTAKLEVIKQKILSALVTTDSPPKWGWAFGAWFINVTDFDDQEFLESWDEKEGSDVVNNWLAGVLTESGKYDCDDEGNVWVKKDSSN